MKPAGLGRAEDEGWNGINKWKYRAAVGRDGMRRVERCWIDRMDRWNDAGGAVRARRKTKCVLDGDRGEGGREGGRRQRWGEPRACLTEEGQGLSQLQRAPLAAAIANACSSKPATLPTPSMLERRVSTTHRSLLRPLPSQSIHAKQARSSSVNADARLRPTMRPSVCHVGRCIVGAHSPYAGSWRVPCTSSHRSPLRL